MKRKVKVTFPKAKKGLEARTSGLEIRMAPGLGYNANQLNWPVMAGEFSQPDVEVNNTLGPEKRTDSNLEAERGETAFTDLNGDGIPQLYKIGGKRHYDGGTPLNLPDNSFIFSRDNSMKIKDPELLKSFGMPPKKGGYTPADISKKYDINKFRKILGDSNTDDLQRKTAENMIANYNLKLGKLALAQESIKGFPQGIPVIAIPYMESTGIKPEELINGKKPQQPSEQQIGEEEAEQQPDNEEVENMVPQGKYGLNMVSTNFSMKKFGGNSTLDKFVSGGSSTRKVRVTMPKFQEGGNPSSLPPDTGKITYDTEDQLYADPNYKKRVAEGRAYLRGSDGKYYKVSVVYPRPPKEAYDDKLGDYKDDYAHLFSQMSDPNVQAAIVKNYRKHAETVKNPAIKKELLAKSPQEIISDLMNLQKQNFAIQNEGWQQIGSKDWVNKGGNWRKMYESTISKTGMSPLDDVTVASGQAGYAAFLDAKKDPETAQFFKGFTDVQRGKDDETYYEGKPQVSPVDGKYGNTTVGQMITPSTSVITTNELLKQEGTKPEDVKSKHLGETAFLDKPRMWKQDIIQGLGAIADWARTKAYRPWNAPLDLRTPRVILASPEREIAAEEEQANVLTNALAASSGPQALSARASQIQGQNAKSIADTLARYTNLNVGLLNQNEQERTSILNQEASMKQQLATNLYDKVTTVNQQFDNTKLAREQRVRDLWTNALTNMANTFNVNTLFPQFHINPSKAGMIDFVNPEALSPDTSEEDTPADIFEKIRYQHPSIDPKDAIDLAMIQSGYKSGKSAESSQSDALKQYMLKAGQYGE